MKKFSPYIFPALVVLLVIFMITRWYDKRGQISDYGEGIEIENLSEEESKAALTGVGDYTTVPLEKTQPDKEAAQPSPLTGLIRYEIDGDRVKLSVIAANFDQSIQYYVWLQPVGSNKVQQAFVLTEGKGGLVGSGSFLTKQLPVEVLISKGSVLDVDQANVVLRGKVELDVSK